MSNWKDIFPKENRYFETENGILYHGDCLKIMKSFPEKSVDLILTDPPYGKTQAEWDRTLPIEKMWKQIKRIRKDGIPIVLFGIEPFQSLLRTSNLEEYRYDWVWVKEQGTNPNLIKKQPLRQHENILVFYNGWTKEFGEYLRKKRQEKGLSKKDIDKILGLNTQYSWWEGRKKGGQLPSKDHYLQLKKILNLDDRFDDLVFNRNKYYPQLSKGKPYIIKRNNKIEYNSITNSYLKRKDTVNNGTRFPTSVLFFKRELKNRYHPTQKPIELLKYLIKTYTLKNDLVLDFTCGSGSTLVQQELLNRRWIGIEIEEKYCEIQKKRILDQIKEKESRLF